MSRRGCDVDADLLVLVGLEEGGHVGEPVGRGAVVLEFMAVAELGAEAGIFLDGAFEGHFAFFFGKNDDGARLEGDV